MKHFYAVLAFVLVALTGYSQYIYNDFDANQNHEFSGWPNIPEVIANPDPSGINTSANVAKIARSGEQWAHCFSIIPGKVNFETGTTFKLKVWSPIVCQVLFKLEDQLNGGINKEVLGNVTTPNQWVEIQYDFTGATSGLYDKLVIFFDFAQTTDNTFYFDDVEGPEYGAGVVILPLYLPVTFDDAEINYALTDFGGNASEVIVDPTNAANTVAKSVKTAVAELWAGTTVGGNVGFANPIPFAVDATSMSVRVWSPTAGTPIRLKVEKSTDPTISVETEANTTVANDWQTLVFDFSNEATGTAQLNLGYSYNKASIFFNFGQTGAQAGEQTYFWDDMEFAGGGVEPKPLQALDVQDNFEGDGYATITNWKFQDPDLLDLTIVTDPANAANHVAGYSRSGSFEWTNAQFVLDHRMDLSDRNQFMMNAYFPSTNGYNDQLTKTVAVKLQNSLLGGEAWTTQTEVKLTVDQLDTWLTLQFDFSAVSANVDYDQVVVQFGGESHLVAGNFYFDNFHLMGPASIFESQLNKVQVSPNPASNMVNITGVRNISETKIINIAGQIVVKDNSGSSNLNVSNLPAGVYSMLVTDKNDNVFVGKLIKD